MSKTTNFDLNKPTVGGSTDTWGDLLNENFDIVDGQLKTNQDAAAAAQNTANTKANSSVNLTAGDGLSGGGNLTANRSFAVDGTVVRTSGNQTVGGTKTFSAAVVLSTAGTTTSHAVRADRNLTAGNGLTGGGNLTANRTFTLGTPSTLSGGTSNAVTASSHTHAISSTASRTSSSTSALLQARAMNNHRTSGDHDGRYARIPAGTRMLFQQTSAPTGWTKVTSGVNNRALRVVSGTAGSGGSNAFTTAFNSARTTSSAGNHSHTITVNNHTLNLSRVPNRTGTLRASVSGNNGIFVTSGTGGAFSLSGSRSRVPDRGASFSCFRDANFNHGGGGGSHNHSASSASAGNHAHALNLNVRYIDVIVAVKN